LKNIKHFVWHTACNHRWVMRNETTITASEWTLPLRRRADQLIRQKRFDEAGRLLMQIRRALRQEPSGGNHDDRLRQDVPARLVP